MLYRSVLGFSYPCHGLCYLYFLDSLRMLLIAMPTDLLNPHMFNSQKSRHCLLAAPSCGGHAIVTI